MIPNILKDHFSLLADTPGGVQKLRELVLQLAVQGALVSQNVEESVVSHCRACGISDPPYPVPENWQWIRLADILVKLTDGTHHSPPNSDVGDFMYVTAKNIKPGGVVTDGITYVSKTIHNEIVSRCDPSFGDILYIKDGATTGVVTINNIRQTFSMLSSVALLKVPQFLLNRYLLHVMRSPFFYKEMRGSMTGVAITRVTLTKMGEAVIPLPPLSEQQRIVAKVDELMALCDELEARQEEAKKVQSHLNRSALARLTQSTAEFSKHWKNAEKSFQCLEKTPENVSELRKTILQVAMMGRLVPCEQSSDSADVSVVRDFVRFLNGYAFQSGWFQARGVRLARNVNVSHGFLDWNDAAFIDEVRAKEFTQFNLLAGDILVSLDRPLISTGLKVAVVRQADLPCLLLQRVAKTEFVGQDVFPPYFFLWLNSPLFTGSIDPGRSKGVPHISTRQIEALPFNPPPLAEQKRIVAKVDELMKLCDELEALMKRAESDGARLFDAVVKGLMAV